jgi:hypothetical protein
MISRRVGMDTAQTLSTVLQPQQQGVGRLQGTQATAGKTSTETRFTRPL